MLVCQYRTRSAVHVGVNQAGIHNLAVYSALCEFLCLTGFHLCDIHEPTKQVHNPYTGR
jgi:hypothetical protein